MSKNMNYLETNALQWDKRTGIHKDSDFYDLEGFKAGRNSLMKVELEEIGDVKNKSLLHLQCHFGQDSISWAKLGARVTGLDISKEAVQLATRLAKEMEVGANFIQSDVYSANHHIADQYDIVFTSYGTIVWLEDLKPWAQVIADRLKPGGFFYMVDFHPFLQLYEASSLKIIYPYFNEGPIEEFGKYTYTDGPELNMTEITFSHSFADMFNALVQVGLRLEFFNEHDFSTYDCFDNMRERAPGEFVFEGFGRRMPHMFSMKWRKTMDQT